MRISPLHFLPLLILWSGCVSPLAGDEAGTKLGTDFHPGLPVDPAAPEPPTAVIDGNTTASTSAAPTISWTASSSNSSAGFAGYEVALGSTAGGTDILNWTGAGNVTSYTPGIGFTLVDGNIYYATVRAMKSNGLRSAAASGDGFAVNAAAATFSCDFTSGTSTDCYAAPYSTTARPLVRFYRSGGANTSPGTYVDSTGTIKTAATNYFTYSEDAVTAYSIKGGVTVTNGAATAPDGSGNAASIVETAILSDHYVEKSISLDPNATYTFSCYVKSAGRQRIFLKVYDGAYTNNFSGDFNLSAGAFSTNQAGSGMANSATLTSLGNGWYRLVVSGTVATGSGSVTIRPRIQIINASTTYTGDGASGILLWGAQLETGLVASNYTFTGITPSYVPRLDHDPADCSGGVCASRGLLMEEPRANLTFPSTYGLTGNTGGNASIVAGTALAPDGTTARKLLDNTNNSRHFVSRNATITANSAHTYSVYVKAAELTEVFVYGGKSGSPYTRGGMTVNLNMGTFTNADVGPPASVTNRTVTPAGNGWYRISMTVNIDATSTDGYLEVNTISNGARTYAGTGTSGIYIWGAQIEQGESVSSYIPTTTAALTRNRDVAIAYALDPNWFDPARGTLYGASIMPYFSKNQFVMDLDDGGASNRIGMYASSAGDMRYNVVSSGVAQFIKIIPAPLLGQSNKAAFAYQANDFAATLNGSSAVTASSGSIPPVDRLSVGAYNSSSYLANGWIQSIQYFNTRLNDNQLKYLTCPEGG